MRVLILTQGQHTVVDDHVYEWASKFKWYAVEQRRTFYAARKVRLDCGKRANLWLHREILKTPKGVFTDHIDGDGLNNLDDNLRTCSRAENAQNRAKDYNNASGYKGVRFHRGNKSWVAQIGAHGKSQKHLGNFNTALEAAHAYDSAALRLHGEFARLNFLKE